jgi:hypothetical protein
MAFVTGWQTPTGFARVRGRDLVPTGVHSSTLFVRPHRSSFNQRFTEYA